MIWLKTIHIYNWIWKRYLPTFLFEFICTEDTRVKICYFGSRCLAVTDLSVEVLSVPNIPLRWKMHDWVFQPPWGRPSREVITLRRWLDYGWNCCFFSSIVGFVNCWVGSIWAKLWDVIFKGYLNIIFLAIQRATLQGLKQNLKHSFQDVS